TLLLSVWALDRRPELSAVSPPAGHSVHWLPTGRVTGIRDLGFASLGIGIRDLGFTIRGAPSTCTKHAAPSTRNPGSRHFVKDCRIRDSCCRAPRRALRV